MGFWFNLFHAHVWDTEESGRSIMTSLDTGHRQNVVYEIRRCSCGKRVAHITTPEGYEFDTHPDFFKTTKEPNPREHIDTTT